MDVNELVLAFEQGYDAYEEGCDICDCPYDDLMLENAWVEGYEEAQAFGGYKI